MEKERKNRAICTQLNLISVCCLCRFIFINIFASVSSCIYLSGGGGGEGGVGGGCDGDGDGVNSGQYTDGDPKYKSTIKNVASIKS